MKIYLCYAAIMIFLGIAGSIYVIQKAKTESPGDATGDFIMIIMIAEMAALAFGFSILTLWRKFIMHEMNVSNIVVGISCAVIVGVVVQGLQIGLPIITAYLKNKK